MIKKRGKFNKYDIKNSAINATINLSVLLVHRRMSEMCSKNMSIL